MSESTLDMTKSTLDTAILAQIKIVLSHTTHPGNIGAVARAMKVMGLSQLCLVNPKIFPDPQAVSMSANATDILDEAVVYQSIEEAIADCRLIIGTSARVRSLPNEIIEPRQLTEVLQNNINNFPVAILFGTEHSGLTNQELQLCHYHLCIPTSNEYGSLNLAAAVQLIAYELLLASTAIAFGKEKTVNDDLKNESVITRKELNGLVEHFENLMAQTGYLDANKQELIEMRLNRLFNKARLETSEYNILRGFLKSIEQMSSNATSISTSKRK